jgi:hypothetical protein
MRIISDFKDYYDSSAHLVGDHTTLFVRNRLREVEIKILGKDSKIKYYNVWLG